MEYFDFHHHHTSRTYGIYNLKFGEEIPATLFSAGIHPDSANENLEAKWVWLKEISTHPKCVAIGECGLDGRFSDVENLQEKIFAEQIALANTVEKPLIIHCVRRFSRLLPILKSAKVPVVLHGYNKRKTIGRDLLKAGFFLSFGKSLLYDVNLQRFFTEVPPERIFLETDSADFELEELYRTAATLKKMSAEAFNEIIQNNIKALNIKTNG